MVFFSNEKSLGPRFSVTELRQFVSVQPFLFSKGCTVYMCMNTQNR